MEAAHQQLMLSACQLSSIEVFGLHYADDQP